MLRLKPSHNQRSYTFTLMANNDLATLILLSKTSFSVPVTPLLHDLKLPTCCCRLRVFLCSIDSVNSLSDIINMALSHCRGKYPDEISQLVEELHGAQIQRQREMNYHHSRIEILHQDIRMAERGYNHVET